MIPVIAVGSLLVATLVYEYLTGTFSRERGGAANVGSYPSSPDGRCRITFPAPPQPVQEQRRQTPAGEFVMKSVAADPDRSRSYMVMWNDLPAMPTQGPERLQVVEDILDAGRKSFVGPGKGKMLSEQKVALGPHSGREYLIQLPDGKGEHRRRVYVVKSRVYQVSVAGRPGVVNSAEAEQFFESFKVPNE